MLRLKKVFRRDFVEIRIADNQPADLLEVDLLPEHLEVVIVRDFRNSYLELIRLLHEAAEIEHALMVQYLYAALSLKPAYNVIAGGPIVSSTSLVGVAIQEMQHLGAVNSFLAELGSSPNLIRQDFPYEPDIYPFEFNLEPISLKSVAKYTYTEAPKDAIDPDSHASDDPFIRRLYGALGKVRPNHLGSLYGTVLSVMDELNEDNLPPGTQVDLAEFREVILEIKNQGEHEHFQLFKSILMATHPGFDGNSGVWDLPQQDQAYPSFNLPMNPSAFEGHPSHIPEPELRKVAWLSDLHYWIILMLLNLTYRETENAFLSLARNHMTGPLWQLGKLLSSRGAGLPFDPLSLGYAPGKNRHYDIQIVIGLLMEAIEMQNEVRDQLPVDFPAQVLEETLSRLTALEGGHV